MFRYLLCLLACAGLLAGCYEFKEPPFRDSQLTSLLDTDFGKKLAEAIKANGGKIAPEKSPVSKVNEKMADLAAWKVLQVNEDMMVSPQKTEKGDRWELAVLMRSASHFMFCSFMPDDEKRLLKKYGGRITATEQKKGMETTILIDGPAGDIEKFATDLAQSSLMFCAAVPAKKT